MLTTTPPKINVERLLGRVLEIAQDQERAGELDWCDVLWGLGLALEQVGIFGAQFCYCEVNLTKPKSFGGGSERLRYLLEVDGVLYDAFGRVERKHIENLTLEEAEGLSIFPPGVRWLKGDATSIGVGVLEAPLARMILVCVQAELSQQQAELLETDTPGVNSTDSHARL